MYKATFITALLLLTSCVSEEKKVNNLEESLKELKEAQQKLDEAFESLDSLDVKVQTDTVQ